MIAAMWPDGQQPVTAAPMARLEQAEHSYSVTLNSETVGASIGYRIVNGVDSAGWQLYTGPVQLPEDTRLEAKAIRYGFKESKVTLLAPNH